MAEVQVTPTENGPYKVTGPIELIDPDGNPIPVPGRTVFLCCCGGSTNKPFCDSWTTRTPPTCARQDGERAARARHSKIGLKATIAAVARAEEG